MRCLSEFLVTYLDSVDERLLDKRDELRPELVKRPLRQRAPERFHRSRLDV